MTKRGLDSAVGALDEDGADGRPAKAVRVGEPSSLSSSSLYPLWLVTEDVKIIPELLTADLSYAQQNVIKQQTLERISRTDPILRVILEVKIAKNQRRNFINVRVRNDFVTLCYHEVLNGMFYCYTMSDKLEPFVIVTVVDPLLGKLEKLSRQQLADLEMSLERFRRKFGVQNEKYHYTPLKERRETDKFVASGGTSSANKAHSSHWHLKIRVATAMCCHLLPIMNTFNLRLLSQTADPVIYNYSRECVGWESVRTAMEAELLVE